VGHVHHAIWFVPIELALNVHSCFGLNAEAYERQDEEKGSISVSTTGSFFGEDFGISVAKGCCGATAQRGADGVVAVGGFVRVVGG
jgi:hypothetical protein